MAEKPPYRLMHRLGESACGGVAIYMTRQVAAYERAKPTDFVWPEGSGPGTPRPKCASCGKSFPLVHSCVEPND